MSVYNKATYVRWRACKLQRWQDDYDAAFGAIVLRFDHSMKMQYDG